MKGQPYRTSLTQTAPNEDVKWSEDVLIRPEPWMRSASCAEVDPDLFFPEGRGAQYYAARQICSGCPVRLICLEYALRTKQTEGIWGALSPKQRARLARNRKGAS